MHCAYSLCQHKNCAGVTRVIVARSLQARRIRPVSEERKYVPVKQRSRSQVEEMLLSGAPEQIGEALWSAAYYDLDWR
jgi:hypothetical protein